MTFKHFKHLNVPDSWERYFTKYPQGMSILEALFEWVSQVDDMVDNQNKLNDNVVQFRDEIDAFVGRFDKRLQDEVTQTLTDWQESGFLNVVISEALQWQLDDYIATNTPFYAQKFIGKLENGQPATVVFLGDSTTEQNQHTGGNPNHVGQVTDYLNQKYGSLATIINSGVSGNTTKQMWARAYKDVVAHNPDLIVICSGLNDVGQNVSPDTFIHYYDNLIKELVVSLGKDVGIILRTPNLTKNSTWNNATLPLLIDETKKVAIKYNIGFADYFSHLISEGYTASNMDNILSDTIHPNHAGHQLIYEFLQPFFTPTIQPKNISYYGKAYSSDYSGLTISDGWFLNTSNLFFMNKGLSTSADAETIELPFQGENVTVFYATGTDRGQFKVSIDNVEVRTIDTYGSLSWREAVVIDEFNFGSHTLKIETLSTRNANATDNAVYIVGFVVEGESLVNLTSGSNEITPNNFDENITVSTPGNFDIPTETQTLLPFTSVPTYSGGALSLENNQVSTTKDGVYMFDVSLVGYFEASKTVTLRVRVNDFTLRTLRFTNAPTAGNMNINGSGIIRMFAGDVLTITLEHDNGTDATFYKNAYSPLLTVAKI